MKILKGLFVGILIVLALAVPGVTKALVKEAGAAVYVLTFVSVVTYFIIGRTRFAHSKWLKAAATSQITWWIWLTFSFVVSSIVTSQYQAIYDVIILGTCLVWFLVSSRLLPTVALLAYQTIAAVINANTFINATNNRAEAIVFIAICFNLTAIVSLVGFLIEQKKSTGGVKLGSLFSGSTKLDSASPSSRLLQLKQLFDDGLITEAEYQQKKSTIIDGV